ncbi:MAG: CMD domain-containing protein [Pseudorhodobacter sp.]
MKDLREMTVLRLAGIAPGTELARAVEKRARILGFTDTAEAAVLKPDDPGGISHDLRLALAARIARLHDLEDLAAFYEAGGAEADPGFQGAGRIAAILAFTDLVSSHPRDAGATDIEVLRDAGIPDADIVRLAELNAFMAYQIRVIEGLRALAKGDAA